MKASENIPEHCQTVCVRECMLSIKGWRSGLAREFVEKAAKSDSWMMDCMWYDFLKILDSLLL